MSFLGKEYALVSQENFDSFINGFGDQVAEDQKKALMSPKSSLTVTLDGDTYTLKTAYPGGIVRKNVFKNGETFDEKMGSIDLKTTATVSGDTIKQVQTAPHGGSFTIERVFSGDECVATYTSTVWDGTAKRYYKAA